MQSHADSPASIAARRLTTDVLAPLKEAFVGKDEIIDLLGVCLVGGENLYLLGPPGTAKTAIVRELGRRLDGRVFDYLLTRFTEPNELFGPFDIRKLRDGELVTNTDGMLPEADLVFLDELLNANSAILNSLLMVIGASNRLPEDDTLGALFDRFLLRVRSDYVPDARLPDVLTAGWTLGRREASPPATMSVQEVRLVQRHVEDADLSEVRGPLVDLIRRLRRAGIPFSDRRAVKIQRLVAASAILCGRWRANASDLWVLRYTWDTEDQREVITALVQDAVEKSDPALMQQGHPRARHLDGPNPEELAKDLEQLETRLAAPDANGESRDVAREQLAILAGRIQWIKQPQQRSFLEERVQALWHILRTTT